MTDALGIGSLFDGEALLQLVVRLAFNLAFATILIRAIYFRLYGSREYVFTYYLFNLVTFCLCLLLQKVPLDLGFALGLFAVFGILRYRTETIGIRDLTYLFIVIGVAIINALANHKLSLSELLAVNGAVVGLTAALETQSAKMQVLSTPMLYDRIELLRPGVEVDLHCDIIERTGLQVVRVEVIRLDMLRDAAEIKVFYTSKLPERA